MARSAATRLQQRATSLLPLAVSLPTLLLPLLLVALLLQLPHAASAASLPMPKMQDMPDNCRGEWQLVMCREIPANQTAALAACCADHKGAPRRPPAVSAAVQVARPDLEQGAQGGVSGGAGGGAPPIPYYPLEWKYDECTARGYAEVPSFRRAANGSTVVSFGF